MDFINELLKAAPIGTCLPAITSINNAGRVEDLLQLLIKNIDFCLSNNYPSKEMIQVYAGNEAADHGIFIDTADIELYNPKFALFYGSSKGMVTLDGFNICQFFSKHGSKIDITIKDSSFAVIDMFDDSFININVLQHSKVLVNVYGNATLNYSGDGTIKVVRKKTDTY